MTTGNEISKDKFPRDSKHKYVELIGSLRKNQDADKEMKDKESR